MYFNEKLQMMWEKLLVLSCLRQENVVKFLETNAIYKIICPTYQTGLENVRKHVQMTGLNQQIRQYAVSANTKLKIWRVPDFKNSQITSKRT